MHRNHVFVIRGDVTRIACDAWLLPSDDAFTVEPIWRAACAPLDLAAARERPWGRSERVRKIRRRFGTGPTVWMGNVGTVDFELERYLTVAESFVRRAARDVKPRGEQARPPLLSLHHLGTGAGGANANKGEVLGALFSRLVETIDELGKADVACDVVVVSWDAAAHAAAQRARLRALATDSMDWSDTAAQIEAAVARWPFSSLTPKDLLVEHASNLAAIAQRGQLSVFMGAGVSAGAGLPGWNHLLEQMGALGKPAVTAEALNRLPDPRDKAALVERYFKAAGKDFRIAVAKAMPARRYSLLHGLLSSLPVNEFITTNFDELFELAATSADRGHSLRVIGGADQARDQKHSDGNLPDPSRWLLKLHGTVSKPETIVLTRSAYLDGPRTRGALFGLVQAMLMTRRMLFVGYGLGDEDFHELVYEVRTARGEVDRLGTAVTLFDEPVLTELWGEEVEVVAVDRTVEKDLRSPEQAGREVELFIDLLGLLAADREAFILDDEYAGMLDEPERELKRAFTSLKVPKVAEDHAGGRAVQALLERLGRRGP